MKKDKEYEIEVIYSAKRLVKVKAESLLSAKIKAVNEYDGPKLEDEREITALPKKFLKV